MIKATPSASVSIRLRGVRSSKRNAVGKRKPKPRSGRRRALYDWMPKLRLQSSAIASASGSARSEAMRRLLRQALKAEGLL